MVGVEQWAEIRRLHRAVPADRLTEERLRMRPLPLRMADVDRR